MINWKPLAMSFSIVSFLTLSVSVIIAYFLSIPKIMIRFTGGVPLGQSPGATALVSFLFSMGVLSGAFCLALLWFNREEWLK